LIAAEKEALQSGKFVIPEKSKNYGWMDEKNIDDSITFIGPIFNVADGGKPYALVSVGKLDGKIFGAKYVGRKFGLLGFAVKNPDGSIGFLFGTMEDTNMSWFFDVFINGYRNTPLFFGDTVIEKSFAGNSFWYQEPLSQIQGGEAHKQALLEKMVTDGKEAKITEEMENIIYFFAPK
ncbi:MAG: hypothetical protein LC099_12370, partial [Anaerolineales bacterium]|nr:hypothetical protein [Anaerolineales bacterium]